MPMATIHKVGQGDLYHVHFLDPHAGHPDQGLPGGGVDPGYGQGRPGIDHGPGRPDRPGQGLPGHSGIPDNTLPEYPPPQVAPGMTLVMIRDQQGKWHYATIAPGSPPPRPLPGPPPHGPGPGAPNRPDQGLPGGPPQYPTGQPVPPTGTPV